MVQNKRGGWTKIQKSLDMSGVTMIYCSSSLGEVSEWFKEPVLKTGDSERGRGFESHLLRLAF